MVVKERLEHIVREDGYEEWLLNGKLHREDGPAVVYPDGSEDWCLHGELHREDGPAVVSSDGSEEWWLHGKRHREGGPACVFPIGSEYWFFHGKRHREVGPAVVLPNGYRAWFIHGQLHREDGPGMSTGRKSPRGRPKGSESMEALSVIVTEDGIVKEVTSIVGNADEDLCIAKAKGVFLGKCREHGLPDDWEEQLKQAEADGYARDLDFPDIDEGIWCAVVCPVKVVIQIVRPDRVRHRIVR